MDENLVFKDDSVTIKINPKLYSLEAIYSAAYVFLDKAYIVLDGNPETEILVKLRLKSSDNLKDLAGCFLNELINYGDYFVRAQETKKIREAILQRALFTNDPSVLDSKEQEEFEELMQELDEEIEDPEGIAVPWEEKYGDSSDDISVK